MSAKKQSKRKKGRGLIGENVKGSIKEKEKALERFEAIKRCWKCQTTICSICVYRLGSICGRPFQFNFGFFLE